MFFKIDRIRHIWKWWQILLAFQAAWLALGINEWDMWSPVYFQHVHSQYRLYVGLRLSESRIDYWIVWELTPINRLRFSKINLYIDCSPTQPIIQTAPVTVQCACSRRTSGQKKHCEPVYYDSMIKLNGFFFIKIHWFKIRWHWLYDTVGGNLSDVSR